jgi:serine/threonine protein kinase
MPDWKVPGYTELKMLGSGGFGRVMLAKHDSSGALVAIKYLRDDLLADAEFAEMFRGEAAVLASLDDPNIVRLYEYAESPSGAAIVMELIGGVSLRDILTYQGKTTAEAALMVLQGSLMGLAGAHRRGVVHRDYKPENVLVTGDGVSKLTDFGIAARAGASPVPAGTLAYAAPEQMAGGPATPASDIYAATATFYECLTGRPPFSGASDELLRQHLSEPVPLDPVPEPLRSLMTAGMAKDPKSRPTDATSFVTELQTAASGAYGRDWQDHGRSKLGEAALLLAALWPTGAPPAAQGTTAHRVPLQRRNRISRLRHIRPVQAVIAAGATVAVAAGGTALAATLTSSGSRAPGHPVAAPPTASLQPSPTLFSSAAAVSTTPGAGSPGSSTATPPAAVPSPAAPVTTPARARSTAPVTPVSSASTSSTPKQTPAAPAVPEITSVSTYQDGELVYFDIHYSDPGNNAEGFGFVGVDGSGWAEENHPFSSPSYGIVGTDSIAYPFNEECGTAQEYSSYVQAWINDTAGDRSTPVTIHLVCTT